MMLLMELFALCGHSSFFIMRYEKIKATKLNLSRFLYSIIFNFLFCYNLYQFISDIAIISRRIC